MAKTIRRLLAYWKHAKLTSASQEGFYNKIGWLTRQAYGYHDEKYLHLKIDDLHAKAAPKTHIREEPDIGCFCMEMWIDEGRLIRTIIASYDTAGVRKKDGIIVALNSAWKKAGQGGMLGL